MKSNNLLKLLIVLTIIFSGCATTGKFSRVGGTKNANLNGIRVYTGPIPDNISYENLGKVSAEGKGVTTLVRLDDALEKLTLKAKDMGANAIINWKTIPKFGWAIEMEGEAVVFNQFPHLPQDKYFLDGS